MNDARHTYCPGCKQDIDIPAGAETVRCKHGCKRAWNVEWSVPAGPDQVLYYAGLSEVSEVTDERIGYADALIKASQNMELIKEYDRLLHTNLSSRPRRPASSPSSTTSCGAGSVTEIAIDMIPCVQVTIRGDYIGTRERMVEEMETRWAPEWTDE